MSDKVWISKDYFGENRTDKVTVHWECPKSYANLYYEMIPIEELKTSQERVGLLEKENGRLREGLNSLEEYVAHGDSCAMWMGHERDFKCTCGLHQAREALADSSQGSGEK